MENSRVVVLVSVVVILGWLSLEVLGGPVRHRVGGSKGWTQDVNYTEWSSHEHIFVGDWLLFMFDKRYYNVLEVNKTSYESCIERDFIKNATRGGRDVVELTEARTYYYLSGGGYCFHGMRVAVQVEEHQLAPSPSSVMMFSSSYSLLPSVYKCIWIVVVANVLFVINLASINGGIF